MWTNPVSTWEPPSALPRRRSLTRPWSAWHNSSERKLSWRNQDRNNTERVNLVLKMIENPRDEIYFLDSSCFMVNRPFQIFSFVSSGFTIRIRRPLVQSLGVCLERWRPGRRWPNTWGKQTTMLGPRWELFCSALSFSSHSGREGRNQQHKTYIWPPRVSPIASFF